MLFSSWLRQLAQRWPLPAGRRSLPLRHRTPKFTRLFLERLEDRLAPATLTVNSVADTVSGTTSTLDLREAILLVNSGGTATDSSGTSLAAAKASQISGTFGVNDTIQFVSSLSGETITLGSALPELTSNVTIVGLGQSNLTISGAGQYQVFDIAGGVTASLSGLTITEAKGNDGNEGGAIFTGYGATTNISDCSFLSNQANGGGAILNNLGSNLIVTDTLFCNNAATGLDGGGLWNSGTAVITGSTFSNNTAAELGGGIVNQGDTGTLTVSNCTFTGNSSNYGGGGGIFNNSLLTVNNSTFGGNSATGSASGGGILNEDTMTATNDTFADNSAFDGGGIGNVNGGSATLNNTIVADSTSGGDLYIDSGNGSTYSGSNDLIGDGSDLSSFANSLSGDPMLASLAVNNGPLVGVPGNQQYLQTMALLSGSPAIDAGSNALAIAAGLTTDERGMGFPRSVGSAVDIGAFESSVVPSTTFVVTDAGDYSQENVGSDDPTDTTNSGISLRSAIAAANVDATNGISVIITFSSALAGDTLTLTQGQLELTAGSGIITIEGSNQITVSGGNQSQIFQVDAGATVNIDGVILENGYADGSATMNQDGGAIYNAGNLTIRNSMLVQNSATVDGGAIATYGTLNAINTTFLGNSAPTGQGGAIVTGFGTTTTISNCIFLNNTGADGGAIHNDTILTVSNSTFSGNSTQSGDGGGIVNNGAATISGSTFTNNTSAGNGGGLANDSNAMTVSNSRPGWGAEAARSQPANEINAMTVSNSTLNGNSATGGDGGGIYNSNGSTLTIEDGSAVYGNQAPQGAGADLENLGGLNVLDSAVASMDNQNPSATNINSTIYDTATSLTASNSAGQLVFTVQVQTVLTVPYTPPPPPPPNFPPQPPPPPPLPPLAGTIILYDGNNNVLDTGTLNANDQVIFTDPAILGSQTPIYAVYTGETAGIGGPIDYYSSISTPLAQTVNALTPSNLQTVVNNLEPDNATAVELQASANVTPAAVIQAVNGLTNVTQPVAILLDLGGGTYSTGGVAANPPPNVSFVVQNGTLDPAYPALTVAGGQVSVVNCMLTTTGNAPTLLVTGGNVTLSNDTISQTSTTSVEPAISVTGGTVNLGTAATPGNNTLSVNNSGNLVSNTSGNAISAVGDTFVVGGTVETAPSLSFISLTTSSASTIPGQTVTLTATVAPDMPGSTPPTGSVDFYDTTTNTDLGTATLSDGVASLKVSDLALGTHVIQASYSGDSTYLPSLASVTQTVTQSIYVLDGTDSGALSLSGNASINLPGNLVVDSKSKTALIESGNAKISAIHIGVVGGVQKTGNATSNSITTGAASAADPLASLAAPTGGTNYGSVNLSGNQTLTINPGVYSSISVSGNATLILNPGVYIITSGGLSVTGNAIVNGTGVTIYNAGGAISVSGNATVNLSAPTSGPYAGIVIFQSRDNPTTLSFSGGKPARLQGTIYAPDALLSLSGDATLNDALVVKELALSGNAAVS